MNHKDFYTQEVGWKKVAQGENLHIFNKPKSQPNFHCCTTSSYHAHALDTACKVLEAIIYCVQ